jgi:hypothetical protein
MNDIVQIPFLRGTLKISRTDCGQIGRVCVNDLCGAMRRSILMRDGTAQRRCPSLAIMDPEHPEELYADFPEAVEFVKWMSSSGKLLRTRGREVLEALQRLRTTGVEMHAQPASGTSGVETIELEYVGNRFSVRLEDGRYMVNATEMARPFDRRPAVWLKLIETVRLREALVEDGISTDLASQVVTTRGPHGATWLEIHLWTQFAQWLSPAFAAWCSKKLVHLLRDGHVELQEEPPQAPPPELEPGAEFCSEDLLLPAPATYEEALTVIEDQHDTIRRQKEFIRRNRHKLRHYKLTVEDREWFTSSMIAAELGISAVRLNLFLMEEGLQERVQDKWQAAAPYRHLRGIHLYEWFNRKTNYLNRYKIEAWTPEGREYILSLWRQRNSYLFGGQFPG